MTGYWFGEGNSSPKAKAPEFEYFPATVTLLRTLCDAQWLPTPLNRSVLLVSHLPCKDVALLLQSLWGVLRECPPTPSQYEGFPARRIFPPDFPVAKFCAPLKSILLANVEELATLYPYFFPPLGDKQ